MHLAELHSKISRYCELSFRLKYKLNLRTATSFYYAYFYSTVSYCIVAWAGILLCTSKADRLNSLQKRTVMNLFSRYDQALNYNEILVKYRILKICDIYKLKLLCTMYKILNMNYCSGIFRDIIPDFPQHGHATRNLNNFPLPFPRTEQIRQSFMYQILNVWNAAPANLKNLNCYASFKKHCTDYLLSQYHS